MLTVYDHFMDKPWKFHKYEVADLLSSCNDMFADLLVAKRSAPPPSGLRECRSVSDEKGLTLELDLPGVPSKDVEVSSQDNVITISYKRGEKTGTYRYTINEDYEASRSTALMRDGLLTLRCPRVEHQGSKRVMIKVE